jgi:DNA-binding IclR family transcriptional regulator
MKIWPQPPAEVNGCFAAASVRFIQRNLEVIDVERQRYLVGPVAKALRVLDIVAESDAGVRLSDVAARAGLPKTTALRYLCTLEIAGYLGLDEAHELYRIGPRFAMLSAGGDALSRLRPLALPAMRALRDQFDETINLGVLRGRDVVYVDIVESTRRLRLQAHVGGKDPVHSTALGKAILSRLPASERARILTPQLSPRTPRTTRTRDLLEAELAEVARCGYAVERGENEEGAVCVGVAIIPAEGVPFAALSMSAPETRMPEAQVRAAARALIDAAAGLSAQAARRSATATQGSTA